MTIVLLAGYTKCNEEYFRRLIMKALTFQGAKDIQVKQVEDPKLQ